MKKLLTIALLLAVAASASALDRSPRKKKRDKKAKTETVVPAPVPEAEPVPVPEPEPAPAEEPVVNDMTLGFSPEQTDSLLAAWRERQRQDAFSEFFKQYILEDSTEVADSTPDSVYSRRLLDLASPIQFPYNSIVKGYINRYTNSRYGTISRILGMSQYYFPIIEEELLREALPVELRALPIIESALSPTAVSPMGAVGLWQFMPTTGKSYGLEINSLVDERRDPYRATQAACRYLKDLFAIYNDWSLAIAAYNCGPGNVNKAIARSGGKNFWEIYDYLPRETRGYVPAFIGASYAYAYHRQHGIEPTEAPIPLSVDTVRINKLMHLGQISSRSTCRSRPCASSIRSTNSTSSRPRPSPTRWSCRSGMSCNTSLTSLKSKPMTRCTSRSTSTRPTSTRNARSAADRSTWSKRATRWGPSPAVTA